MNPPASVSDRITSLDAIRGVAVCGILIMNAVSFGLRPEAYFNISADGIHTSLDWIIGVTAEILIDQKMMALFSMLFGASVVLFYDRVKKNGESPIRTSLWRNFLLLLIGLIHGVIWIGDVLFVYAACAPFVLLLKRLPVPLLFALGSLCTLSTVFTAPYFQQSIPADGTGLESIWISGDEPSFEVLAFILLDVFGRAFGCMLIGVSLYRSQIITGNKPEIFYRRTVAGGLAIGIPLAAYGTYNQFAHDFQPTVALTGEIPNTFATIPIALAWMAGVILWNRSFASANRRQPGNWQRKMQAVGRMALSNYLSQTVLGMIFLKVLLENNTRTQILLFVLLTWGLQLFWSERWLAKYRFGPVEWLWRCATRRRIEPNRRSA